MKLGYGIVADAGPSGLFGHWAIAGVPDPVMEAHSKGAAELGVLADEGWKQMVLMA